METVTRVSHALPDGDDIRKLRSKDKLPMTMFVAARWMPLICATRRTMAKCKTRMIGHDQEGRETIKAIQNGCHGGARRQE